MADDAADDSHYVVRVHSGCPRDRHRVSQNHHRDQHGKLRTKGAPARAGGRGRAHGRDVRVRAEKRIEKSSSLPLPFKTIIDSVNVIHRRHRCHP
eukprot:136053-Pyramimonas_sp.AAC.1